MTTAADDDTTPSFRFKRRKTTHTKRARTDDDAPNAPDTPALDATPAPDAPETAQDEEETAPNLKEILRNRKRPRDRLKDAALKPSPSQNELAQADAPRTDQYTSRFIAQTGQVVDSSDAQMTAYVEARLAEQNHRKYGWPIPAHLQATVSAMAPDLKPSSTATREQDTTTGLSADADHLRTAATHGKLEEVALPSAPQPPPKTQPPAPKQRLSRTGKPFRARNRRTSTDLQRDAAVDAILRESKISFFSPAPAAPPPATDEDMLERFRNEYYEAAEERQARRPPAGASAQGREQPKGPKLGGSRSQRAAMAVAAAGKGGERGEGKR